MFRDATSVWVLEEICVLEHAGTRDPQRTLDNVRSSSDPAVHPDFELRENLGLRLPELVEDVYRRSRTGDRSKPD